MPRGHIIRIGSDADCVLDDCVASISMRKIRKALRCLPHPLSRRALFLGVAPAFEHAALMRTLAIQNVVDVGANRGQFALLAKLIWPDATIISFEPLPAPAAKFRQVLGGSSNVSLVERAAGESACEMEIHESARDDSSSLLPIAKAQVEFAPGTHEIARTVVKVRRLDEMVSVGDLIGASLLKIDVQGFEGAVLRGAGALLGHFQYVYCELSFRELYVGSALAPEVMERLRCAGFTLSVINNLVYDSARLPVQADFLFRNLETPKRA